MRKIIVAAVVAGFAMSAAPADAQRSFPGFSGFNIVQNGPASFPGFGGRPPFNPPVVAPQFFTIPSQFVPANIRNILFGKANPAFLGAFGISQISNLFGIV